MALNYPRLLRRKHIFYMRVSIPDHLFLVALKKEFVYSLHTSDYFTAIRLYPNESAFVNRFLEFLRVVKMRVVKSGDTKTGGGIHINMEPEDMDNILYHRLEEFMKFATNYYTEIRDNQSSFEEISLRNRNNTADCDCINNNELSFCIAAKYFLNYLRWWKRQPNTDYKIKNLIDKIFENKTNIHSDYKEYQKLKNERWFSDYTKKLIQVEDYAERYIDDIKNRIPEKDREITPPLIDKLLNVYKTTETQKILKERKVKTLWRTLFNQFYQIKLNSGVKAITLKEYEYKLSVIFNLLGKTTLESITAKDLKELSTNIHCVPTNWKQKNGKKDIRLGLLSRGAKGTLSNKTIRTYLTLFLEFLNFAIDNEVIAPNLPKYVIMPKLTGQMSRDGFNDDDLLLIFNPKTYPSRYGETSFSKFWVPLIALYSGARANEICQLRVNDIIQKGKVWCFNISDRAETQSLKNKQSNRIVPIHPIILDLGFIDFVNKVKENKKEQIFHNLTYTEKNQYAGAITKWFARYLDTIGLSEKSKVFHSFRHTFETKCVDKKLTAEVQNQLCGWTNHGVGQRIYNKGMDVLSLLKELKKVQYPCLFDYLNAFQFDKKQKDCSGGNIKKR